MFGYCTFYWLIKFICLLSNSKGCWFEPHRWHSHCVVSLSKMLYRLLSTGSTQEGLKISDWDVKNQTKQTNIRALTNWRFAVLNSHFWCWDPYFLREAIFFCIVGLPLFGKEGSGTPVFKILVRALKYTDLLTYMIHLNNMSGES